MANESVSGGGRGLTFAQAAQKAIELSPKAEVRGAQAFERLPIRSDDVGWN